MDIAGIKAFLVDQVSPKHQVLLPPVFGSAYAAVRATVKDTPFLSVQSATFNRGRLITWAVDHAVENLIRSGKWNVDYRWASFGKPNPTGKYLEILPPQSRITISQVANPRLQPRDVKFRDNARLYNYPLLFPEMEEDCVTGRPAILLFHGHQDLRFIHLGIPDAKSRYSYICRTGNLLDLPHDVTHPGPPVEDTSFKDTITLKEQIAKWLRDHGRISIPFH